MQLTQFTDLGLRVLMYLTQPRTEPPITISEIATQFDVSRHHLVKVVQHLSQHGWIQAKRGRSGGLSLGRSPESIRLGVLIRSLETTKTLVNCSDPPCGLRGHCHLKGIFDQALNAMYETLDQFTLSDAIKSPTREALIRLMVR